MLPNAVVGVELLEAEEEACTGWALDIIVAQILTMSCYAGPILNLNWPREPLLLIG